MRLLAAWSVLLSLAVPEAPLPTPPMAVWRHVVSGWGQPAIDDGSVFVLTRSHEVVAFDASSGGERWRVATGGPGDAPSGSAVRVLTGTVVVGDDAVIALDRRTGATHWRFVPERGHGAGIFLGGADEDAVAAGSASGHVYVLDASTGRLRWTDRVIQDHAAAVVHPPVLAGDRVVLSYTRFGPRLGGGVAAYTRGGRRLWHVRLPDSTGAAGGPLVAGGWLAVARTDGVIQGFSLEDGGRRWRLPRARGAAGRARDIRPLAIVGNRLVAGSLSGGITAYAVDRQRECWRAESPSGAAALRLTTDGTNVYAPLTSGTLLVLSAADGRERWRVGEPEDRVWWPPGVGHDHIVIAAERSVRAFKLEAGSTDGLRGTAQGEDR